jgi:hypothetical protein
MVTTGLALLLIVRIGMPQYYAPLERMPPRSGRATIGWRVRFEVHGTGYCRRPGK